ncbi:MAG: S8 family serine peptidase [Deltaproteobacteria bacterium]|nr:S8 family serine peptidase [Deltaproteobacteria bacterium]
MKIVHCYRYLSLIFICALFLISIPYGHAVGGEGVFKAHEALVKKASDEGHVKVIVRLAVPGLKEKTDASRSFRSISPGQVFSSDAVQVDSALAQAIGTVADSVIHSLDPKAYEVNHTYSTIPFLAMDVSLKALSALQSLPSVIDIVEDIPVGFNENLQSQKSSFANASADNADISQNLKLIGADVAWRKGYTGSGWYVAVLDTGIRSSHEMFRDKKIVEACFSASNDCPNQSTEMKGSGSAAHYYDYKFVKGYDHGTHVAGIAAGNSGTVFGVAKDADIIAVQVFSRFTGIDACHPNTHCVLTYDSDLLKGLEYVYTIRGSYSIAAVNMSLGGGKYDSYCDGRPLKAAIDNLREAGISTIIASGNQGYCGAINTPACISSSVSTGATNDEDRETDFSNWHRTLVDFFAPGYRIYSATAAGDTTYESWNGTSMATPHVAGAWTLMKQCESNGDVTELYNALKATGKNVTTRCGGADSRPRINVDNAVSYLKGILPAPTLSVAINGTNVTVSWNSVPTAESYVLFYGFDLGFLLETNHQIPMGGKTALSADLPVGGVYYVAVKAYNDAGSSDYSNVEVVSVTENAVGLIPRD